MNNVPMKKRIRDEESVVVTGLGVVSPIGIGVGTFWRNLLVGMTGIDFITRFDTSRLGCKVGAEVKAFDPLNYMDRKLVRETDIFIQFALAASREALEDAEKVQEVVKDTRFGVMLGSCVGGLASLIKGQETLEKRGPERISPKFITQWIPNMAAYQVAAQFGARGPSLTISTACASSNNAFGLAKQVIQQGEADVVVAGGAESLFVPLVYAGLGAARAMTRSENPQKASRPFDMKRDGMVMGEGAGIAVLESRRHAERRGARIYCEVAGYATNGEGYHVTAPAPDGRGERLAMAQAIEEAGLLPEEIEYINAHATSTPMGDEVETMAIKEVFGEHANRLMVSSIKGATGHLLGASGAIEMVATVKALEEGWIPPTINLEFPDPKCDLDYVPNQAREAQIQTALTNSFGFGGQNASLVLKNL